MKTAKEINLSLKGFIKVVEKIQKIIPISYIEIIFNENDAYIQTKEDFLFIVSLDDYEIFITHKNIFDENVYWTELIKKFKKTKLKYIVDDYLTI